MSPQEWLNYLLDLSTRYRSVKEITYRDDITFQIDIDNPDLIRSFFEAVNKTSFTRQLDVMQDIGIAGLARLQVNLTVTDKKAKGTYALYWSDDTKKFEINQFKDIVSDEYPFLAGRMSYDKNAHNTHKIDNLNVVESWLKNQVTASASFETVGSFNYTIVENGFNGLLRNLDDYTGCECGGGCESLLEQSGEEIIDIVRDDPPRYHLLEYTSDIKDSQVKFSRFDNRSKLRFMTDAITTEEQASWNQMIKIPEIDEMMAGVDPDNKDEIKENLILLFSDTDLKYHCTDPSYKFLGTNYIYTGLNAALHDEYRTPDQKNPGLDRYACKHLLKILIMIVEDQNDRLLDDMAEKIKPKLQRDVYSDHV